jgi:hypothetical protein
MPYVDKVAHCSYNGQGALGEVALQPGGNELWPGTLPVRMVGDPFKLKGFALPRFEGGETLGAICRADFGC